MEPPVRIRSITIGQRQSFPVKQDAVTRAGAFAQKAREAFQRAGYEVQTLRLATQPISVLLGAGRASDAPALAAGMELAVTDAGINYCSLGPIMATDKADASPLIAQIPEVLASTKQAFVSVTPAATSRGFNLRAIRESAEALFRATRGDEEGARSRRFTISANVPPNGPFFPSAYHAGAGTAFSLALEAADLAVDAFSEASTLDEARTGLKRRLLRGGRALERIAERLANANGVAFRGMDISLAPFPEEARSIGHAIERLGVERYGGHGTLFASAFITGVLAEVPLFKCGFSGLMIPLLEDHTMARRHAEGAYTLDSLLLYSAVCGAGLDTIPVPGDATAEQIASVYLDVCTLAVALDKPLTCRLMPLAGKRAGDEVKLAFPYFAPTRVVALGPGAGRLLRKGDWVRKLGKPS